MIISVCSEGLEIAPLLEILINMLFTDFYNKLKRLNSRLFVKDEASIRAGFDEFKNTGLFLQDAGGGHKFLMAIPRYEVPEYSIAAIDFNKMIKYGEIERVQEIERTGLGLQEEKMLHRGWRAIITGLINQGYVSKEKANKLFHTHFDTNIKEYPRNYINRSF